MRISIDMDDIDMDDASWRIQIFLCIYRAVAFISDYVERLNSRLIVCCCLRNRDIIALFNIFWSYVVKQVNLE